MWEFIILNLQDTINILLIFSFLVTIFLMRLIKKYTHLYIHRMGKKGWSSDKIRTQYKF